MKFINNRILFSNSVYKEIIGQSASVKYIIREKLNLINNQWVEVFANYTDTRNFELLQDKLKTDGCISHF